MSFQITSTQEKAGLGLAEDIDNDVTQNLVILTCGNMCYVSLEVVI